METDLILGTAGHIDHGKTALVRALTGVDTDRLPEEKKRGITIELGFAHLQLGPFQLGIVDVPGHERFVRQMLAGATGMDLAMLVVAADDSVKPQTREHMDVLRLLEVSRGLIVLTKCDLADAEWIDLVEAEVRELVQGSFLQQAPVIRTSAHTGQGLDQLKDALQAAACAVAETRADQAPNTPFRMAIDRVFTVAGHGTVVTGSVVSGRTQVGDELMIQPAEIPVRVRGLQNHDRPVTMVQRGQRAAINLAGVHHEAIGRGNELSTGGHLRPGQLLTVALQMLPSAPRPLRHRERVRIHVGTAEILATVSLLDQSRIPAGERGWAQLFLRHPAATTWRQPFVMRSESPLITMGGGHVLVPQAEKLRRLTDEQRQHLAALAAGDPAARAAAALFFQGIRPWSAADLLRLAGIQDGPPLAERLLQQGQLVALPISPRRTAQLHRDVIEAWLQRLEQALEALHRAHPLQPFLPRATLLQKFAYAGDRDLLEAILNLAVRRGIVCETELGVALARHRPQLSPRQQEALTAMIDRFRTAGFQPPAIAECHDLLPKQEKEIEKLAQLAAADGYLVHVGKGMYLHREADQALRERLTDALSQSEGMTLSAIRELLGTTRKFAVPLCEYLDKTGFTRRHGDLRTLAELPR